MLTGWIVEEIYNQYLNISSHLSLSGSFYITLPDELKHLMEGLITIKNHDNKCFIWCHARHLNLVDKNPQRLSKEDREVFKKLSYQGAGFPVSKTDYGKIKF